MWEQYIRDLAVFGTNAIELIPPRSDDAADSPHFPLPPMRMMIEMSRLRRRLRPGRLDLVSGDGQRLLRSRDGRVRAEGMGRSVPAAAAHRCGLRARRRSRPHRAEVPDGAARESRPKCCTGIIRKAQMWVSPQSFNQDWMDEFLGDPEDQQPAWLSGVVFGPQVRMSLPELRAAVPAAISDSPLSRHHAQPPVRSIPCPIGMWPTP